MTATSSSRPATSMGMIVLVACSPDLRKEAPRFRVSRSVSAMASTAREAAGRIGGRGREQGRQDVGRRRVEGCMGAAGEPGDLAKPGATARSRPSWNRKALVPSRASSPAVAQSVSTAPRARRRRTPARRPGRGGLRPPRGRARGRSGCVRPSPRSSACSREPRATGHERRGPTFGKAAKIDQLHVEPAEALRRSRTCGTAARSRAARSAAGSWWHRARRSAVARPLRSGPRWRSVRRLDKSLDGRRTGGRGLAALRNVEHPRPRGPSLGRKHRAGIR